MFDNYFLNPFVSFLSHSQPAVVQPVAEDSKLISSSTVVKLDLEQS